MHHGMSPSILSLEEFYESDRSGSPEGRKQSYFSGIPLVTVKLVYLRRGVVKVNSTIEIICVFSLKSRNHSVFFYSFVRILQIKTVIAVSLTFLKLFLNVCFDKQSPGKSSDMLTVLDVVIQCNFFWSECVFTPNLAESLHSCTVHY